MLAHGLRDLQRRMDRILGDAFDVVAQEPQQELQTQDDQQRRQHDGSRRRRNTGLKRPDPVQRAECRSADQHTRPEQELDGSHRDIPEVVRVEGAFEPDSQVFAEELAHHATNLQMAYFAVVFRIHGYIADDGPEGAESKQDVRLEEIALAYLVQRQHPHQARVDGRVAIGGVKQIPVSRRKFRHEGEDRISRDPHGRHRPQIGQIKEPIALRVVGLPGQDGPHEGHQYARIHLAIAVYLHNDARPFLSYPGVTGHHRPTHAQVHAVIDAANPGIVTALLHQPPAAVGATIIHHVDVRYLVADIRDYIQHLAANPLSGNHHRDRPLLTHAHDRWPHPDLARFTPGEDFASKPGTVVPVLRAKPLGRYQPHAPLFGPPYGDTPVGTPATVPIIDLPLPGDASARQSRRGALARDRIDIGL